MHRCTTLNIDVCTSNLKSVHTPSKQLLVSFESLAYLIKEHETKLTSKAGASQLKQVLASFSKNYKYWLKLLKPVKTEKQRRVAVIVKTRC